MRTIMSNTAGQRVTRSDPHARPQAPRGMGGRTGACHGTPAAEDGRGVAQRQDPLPNGVMA